MFHFLLFFSHIFFPISSLERPKDVELFFSRSSFARIFFVFFHQLRVESAITSWLIESRSNDPRSRYKVNQWHGAACFYHFQGKSVFFSFSRLNNAAIFLFSFFWPQQLQGWARFDKKTSLIRETAAWFIKSIFVCRRLEEQ